PCSASTPDTACTMPGRSGQDRARTRCWGSTTAGVTGGTLVVGRARSPRGPCRALGARGRDPIEPVTCRCGAVRDGTLTPMDVTIDVVDDEHAGELLTVRRAAFVTEAQIYQDPHLPALTQSLTELRADLARDDVVTIGGWHGTRLVGSVRVQLGEER